MKEVILGLPGPWADDNLEIADHYTTKIGGYPDWPFPESLLGTDFLECGSCKSKLCLISQVYAPIHDSALKIEERVIYVFGCLNSPCGSWRAIRVQKPSSCGEPELVGSEAGPSIVSSSASESKDSDDDMSLEELSKALFEAASLASKRTKQKGKRKTKTNSKPLSLKPDHRKVDSGTIVLPCFYIYSQEDKSSQDPSAVSSNYSSLSVKEAQDYEDNTDPIQEETWEEEGYEYDRALNADRIYLKFKKRLDKCPEQCFRYSFGGKPLLASGDVTEPTTCGLCGEPRHHELQFMSPLVYFLQGGATGGQKDLLENWNWMTLIVYTCSKSCFQKVDSATPNWDGWTVAEETVIAQFEKPLTESSHLGYLS
ncbi:probable 20S rRNA accumulation protein 4 [Chenopodium quinoa]|uniref:probable 20S rRNA accumulation protein 4 n=1 Tax=Chenopodium quinoa TaxID=63459 RepID=UPI000B794DC4|nr:probable 20S rRNA accumulation protein 4 [Chenopodium quinoa]XP_021759118.1 probable 20S rRNA accumulation protein 4 [Chenopodium quinoa]